MLQIILYCIVSAPATQQLQKNLGSEQEAVEIVIPTMSDPPSTPPAAKSNIQFATKKASSAALSVASDGSGTSANSSGKQSLNNAQTFHIDESQKKHRDVGEVMAGLFSRKKRGRKGTGEHDYEDRGESRDGAGSEASSSLDAYDDEHGYVLNSLDFQLAY